ncbi:MAG: hypothetical protein H6509_05180 [Bryobacterales bacterium]|nr:hypothetical protein [Acidobacteriota bacterium]MCB9383984.1 hypothetical protein [Bryobacterales bacterium]
MPNIGFTAQTARPRSEAGVGALMPWADALWATTYNSHKQSTGKGLGLYRIDDQLRGELVDTHDGTHANRLVHKESDQCFIGPYAIKPSGEFRFIEDLRDHRLTATMRHLSDPEGRVYMLTMEGLLFELDVDTLKATQLYDLVGQLGIAKRPHFKGGFTGQGRVVVANNGFYEFGDESAGLFEFDGSSWRAISRKPHMDCAGRQDMHNVLFATGWDESSVLFHALVNGEWQHYRLPKASHAFAHAWQTEWMRIREVETEHFLMDIQGMIYELQPMAFEGRIWGVKPICQHLRIIPDYCSFRGLLALGGNQTTANNDNNPLGGQPQSGVWFGITDDLWKWGKPQGWGGPWRKTQVQANVPSEPYLMTGFDKKVLHLKRYESGRPMHVSVEIDFLGDGDWSPYEVIPIAGSGYAHHEFPSGFSAHWVRLTSSESTTLSAEFVYT